MEMDALVALPLHLHLAPEKVRQVIGRVGAGLDEADDIASAIEQGEGAADTGVIALFNPTDGGGGATHRGWFEFAEIGLGDGGGGFLAGWRALHGVAGTAAAWW